MAETPMPDTPSGFALDVLDDLKADLAQALSERDRLLALLVEAWEFPDYPTPGEGLVSTEEDYAEQEAWREKYEVLDERIHDTAASITEPEGDEDG
jgi:hypothetical protein